MFETSYVEEHRDHYLNSLLPAVSGLVLITSFGIFGNLNIVWASVRKPQLRSKCNILIAILSFVDAVHQCGHFILFYLIFSAKNFMTIQQCYWLQLHALISMNMGTFLMFSLGVDRLLCVLMPIQYKQITLVKYFGFKLPLPFLYSFSLNYVAYFAMQEQPESFVVCTIPAAFIAWSKKVWGQAMFFVTVLTILVYLITWITIYMKNHSMDRKLMRSLSLIMVMLICGNFLISLSLVYDSFREIESEELLAHHMYGGLAINATIAMNYPIYYFNNQEYRQAFKEQWRILTRQKEHNPYLPKVSSIQSKN